MFLHAGSTGVRQYVYQLVVGTGVPRGRVPYCTCPCTCSPPMYPCTIPTGLYWPLLYPVAGRGSTCTGCQGKVTFVPRYHGNPQIRLPFIFVSGIFPWILGYLHDSWDIYGISGIFTGSRDSMLFLWENLSQECQD